VLPADVSLAAIAVPLAERLHSLVQRHNRVVREAAAMQLRVAIHTGAVSYDGYGIVSTDVSFLFRMLEARALKKLLASSAAEVALIVSGPVHRDLVTMVPDMEGWVVFRPVRFQVRYTKARAWICLPG
jgi:class 3 adenylate cyclase